MSSVLSIYSLTGCATGYAIASLAPEHPGPQGRRGSPEAVDKGSLAVGSGQEVGNEVVGSEAADNLAQGHWRIRMARDEG